MKTREVVHANKRVALRRRKDLYHVINQISGLFPCYTICKVALSCLVLFQSSYCFVELFPSLMSQDSATLCLTLGLSMPLLNQSQDV